jgi:hypothetical protein
VNINVRKTFGYTPFMLLAATVALSLTHPFDVSAQAPPDLDKLVKYAQCIRSNGYPEFPDPSPDGRMQVRIDPKSASKFEAAQRACKDKVPSGMAADQNVTPERLLALVGFAECVRKEGVTAFPDPNSKGAFEVTGSSLDMSTPQVRQALDTCMASNPIGGLQIRRSAPE